MATNLAQTQASGGDKESLSEKNAQLESVVIRFAGDSGDGMQLTGTQFRLPRRDQSTNRHHLWCFGLPN